MIGRFIRKNSQRGEIASIIALIGLGIVTVGIIAGRTLVRTGPQDTSRAVNILPTATPRVIQNPTRTPTPTPTPITPCYDSDSGQDYYRYGYTTLYSTRFDDRCSLSTSVLLERYCSSATSIATFNFICPRGCTIGACAGPSPTPTRTPTPGVITVVPATKTPTPTPTGPITICTMPVWGNVSANCSSLGNASVVWKWSKISEATQYRLHIADNPSFVSPTVYNLPAPTLAYATNNLPAGKTWSARVRVQTSTAACTSPSVWSYTKSVTCEAAPTPTPTPTGAYTPPPNPNIALCTQSGGTWQTYADSCADKCEKITNPNLQCLQYATPSCNCGASKCWSSNGCINNPPTSTPTPPVIGTTHTPTPTNPPSTPNPTNPPYPPITITLPPEPTLPPQGNEMSLTFSPSTATLPPNSTFNIVMDAQARNIAFGRVVFTFDPSKVNLAGEITTNSNLSTVVEKSTMSLANANGKAIIVIAASPTDSQPTGSFAFATFILKSVASGNDSATVTFDSGDMQIVDGTGTAVPVVPTSLSLTLNAGNISGLPTEIPGVGDFEVPIGTKDSLTISIGGGGPTPTQPPGTIPQITFSAKLNHTVNNPEMYMRLRVKDDLFFLDNPGAQTGTCSQAGAGEKDFYVPMRHDGNVYRPVSSINATAPGGTIADVMPDGWVVLNGITAENYYTFILKAPKFRGSETVEHAFLTGGQNNEQNFDWEGIPLEPGDLVNPNQGSVQDCTVNSVDISLMVSRLGTTDQANLDVADVNFDGIVNGNDISKVVNTLSTKPDDDL